MGCPDGGASCMGASVVFRVSFALALFHLIVLFVIAFRLKCSAFFHDGCWVSKFFIIAVVFIPTLWIPNTFFKIYGYFSLICSFFMLTFQGAVIIGGVLKILFREFSDLSRHLLITFGTAFGVLTTSLVLISVELALFYKCWENIIMILAPLIFGIVYVVAHFFITKDNDSLFS